jgi:hypothetical protein
MRRRRIARLAVVLPFLATRPLLAQSADPVILTVEGRVPGPPRDFTLAELESLGTEALRTTTPWTRGMQAFSGVPLLRLLQATGGGAVPMRAEALNRYAVALDAEDATLRAGLLATRWDGQPMRVRDRGPIWLVFPWSERPELDRPEVHERSIWQLRRLTLG